MASSQRQGSPTVVMVEGISRWTEELDNIKRYHAEKGRAETAGYEAQRTALQNEMESLQSRICAIQRELELIRQSHEGAERQRDKDWLAAFDSHLKAASSLIQQQQAARIEETPQSDPNPSFPPNSMVAADDTDDQHPEIIENNDQPDVVAGASTDAPVRTPNSAISTSRLSPDAQADHSRTTLSQLDVAVGGGENNTSPTNDPDGDPETSREDNEQSDGENELLDDREPSSFSRSGRLRRRDAQAEENGAVVDDSEHHELKTVEFDHLFQDGNAEQKHMIVCFPKRSNDWFILRCDEHNLTFGLNPLLVASRHLLREHSRILPGPGVAIKHLGIRVLNCDAEKAERNNAAFREERNTPARRTSGRPRPRRNQRSGGQMSRQWQKRQHKLLPLKPIARKSAMPTYAQLLGHIKRGTRRSRQRQIDVEEDANESSEHSEEDVAVKDQKKTTKRRGFRGILDPVVGGVYQVFWKPSKSWYAALVLPTGPFAAVGISGSIGETALVKRRIPTCYRSVYDASRGVSYEWTEGYEDGGPNVAKRRFPMLYFDDDLDIPIDGEFKLPAKNLLAWVPAMSLRHLDLRDADARDKVQGFEAARSFRNRMHLLDERRRRGNQSGTGQHGRGNKGDQAELKDGNKATEGNAKDGQLHSNEHEFQINEISSDTSSSDDEMLTDLSDTEELAHPEDGAKGSEVGELDVGHSSQHSEYRESPGSIFHNGGQEPNKPSPEALHHNEDNEALQVQVEDRGASTIAPSPSGYEHPRSFADILQSNDEATENMYPRLASTVIDEMEFFAEPQVEPQVFSLPASPTHISHSLPTVLASEYTEKITKLHPTGTKEAKLRQAGNLEQLNKPGKRTRTDVETQNFISHDNPSHDASTEPTHKIRYQERTLASSRGDPAQVIYTPSAFLTWKQGEDRGSTATVVNTTSSMDTTLAHTALVALNLQRSQHVPIAIPSNPTNSGAYSRGHKSGQSSTTSAAGASVAAGRKLMPLPQVPESSQANTNNQVPQYALVPPITSLSVLAAHQHQQFDQPRQLTSPQLPHAPISSEKDSTPRVSGIKSIPASTLGNHFNQDVTGVQQAPHSGINTGTAPPVPVMRTRVNYWDNNIGNSEPVLTTSLASLNGVRANDNMYNAT
ncbi:hypothetical protein BX600DRAFT_438213 [Xylariales sp. PMI_506]|nr:hypothetical protein BX600DRAFT_438213 [Xylariales sp. PMI_506]